MSLIIHNDLLNIIFLQSNGRTIIKSKLACKLFNKLIDDKLINKIKYCKFPRIEGKAKIHDISDYHINININKSINYLYDNQYDLVRGDFIHIGGNEHPMYIFDGIKIINCIPFSFIKNYEAKYILPKEFTIINDNVPKNYWYCINEADYIHDKNEYTKRYNLLIFYYAWFDHSRVKFTKINSSYSTFICNDTKYDLTYLNEERLNDDKLLIMITSHNNDKIHTVEYISL